MKSVSAFFHGLKEEWEYVGDVWGNLGQSAPGVTGEQRFDKISFTQSILLTLVYSPQHYEGIHQLSSGWPDKFLLLGWCGPPLLHIISPHKIY